jgi:hypothetical protein
LFPQLISAPRPAVKASSQCSTNDCKLKESLLE